MEAKTYIQFALRTEASDKNNTQIKILSNLTKFTSLIGFPLDRYISGRLIKQRNIRLLHFAIGLTTEIAEISEFLEKEESKLDYINLSEECADILWYMCIAIDELKLNPAILDTKTHKEINKNNIKNQLEKSTLLLLKDAGNILDYMKKSIFYGKELDIKSTEKRISNIIAELDFMCKICDLDFIKSREININKLSKRYGNKFTEYNAMNRDLDTERKILDKIIS